jgi:hypothetical protein
VGWGVFVSGGGIVVDSAVAIAVGGGLVGGADGVTGACVVGVMVVIPGVGDTAGGADSSGGVTEAQPTTLHSSADTANDDLDTAALPPARNRNPWQVPRARA